MDLGLKGKAPLVTGSTSGIGEAIAKTLAAEGVRVVVRGRREAESRRVVAEITAAGGAAGYALGDLATDAGADAVAEAAGAVDILVNNAGMYVAKGWFEETADEWGAWYNANGGSMVRLNNRLVPGMQARG